MVVSRMVLYLLCAVLLTLTQTIYAGLICIHECVPDHN